MTSLKCIIPGCPVSSSNLGGPPVSSFACPKECRDDWLKVMPKKPDPLPEKLIVCERHFEPDAIQRTGSCQDEQGNVVTFKLGSPRLKPGTVPTIFPRFAEIVPPADPKRPGRPVVVGGSRRTKAFSDYSVPPPHVETISKPSESSPKIARPKLDVPHMPSTTSDGGTTKHRINQRTYCNKCLTFLDGPCYEHASPSDYVFDKPPVPLAYSSLPDGLSVSAKEVDNEDGLPVAAPEESVIAKETLRAGMLFGPLIAPLTPLEEVEEPPRYVLWSEDTEEFQAYDLGDDYVCNWIKFIRPTSDFAQVNLVAYQQKDHIYFFTVKEVRPNTELRVFVKIASNCKVLDDWVFPLLDHLLIHREEPEESVDELSAEYPDNDNDNDDDYNSPSPSPSPRSSRKRKPKKLVSGTPSTREKYTREAKKQRVSYQQDETMEYDASQDSDEYGAYEEEEEADSDDDINEAAFEKLEEFKEDKGSKSSGKKRIRKKTSSVAPKPPTTLEEELLKIQKRKERKNERGRIMRKERKGDTVYMRYRNNEMTDAERVAFEKWRERRRGYHKAAYRERTAINRRYANGEISLEEKKALEQERITKGNEQSLITRTGVQKLSNIEKAVDAVMNRGMSLREAKDLYEIGGWSTLQRHLVKAGFHPSQAKAGTQANSITNGSSNTAGVLEET